MRYYVKTGLLGYGPDLEVEDGSFELGDVCWAVQFELRQQIDMLHDDFHQLTAVGHWEDACQSMLLLERLENVHANFDPERANAPLYRDDPDLWDRTVERLIAETFPLEISTSGYHRLYVWEASEDECVCDDVPEPEGYVCGRCRREEGQ